MRTLKFRVFDTEHNCYTWDKGDWSLGVNSGMVRGIYGEEFPEMIVEQFTGLLDKNGKEIYEGDQVQVKVFKNTSSDLEFEDRENIKLFDLEDLMGGLEEKFTSEVKWEEGGFMVRKSESCDIYLGAFFGDMRYSYPIYQIEVIGNIHEK